MCGICGVVSSSPVHEAEVRRMAAAIAHRGPDDEGFYVNGRVGLGNRRLSIIDLAGGHMPQSNEEQTIWITYNGEIYNYPQLKRELEQRGHTFRTRSDTEVIVHLYEELGERCVERLRGMFALAIWDHRRQKLFLARDRLGQKPLYYARVGDDLYFASEIKGLLASGRIHPEMDLEAMHHYLSLRFIPPPRTMLCGVHKLPAGHTLTFQDGRLHISRYWELSFQEKSTAGEAELAEGLKEKLEETVAAHLISDVPLGAFLSGGMDSSIIVAMMARRQTGRTRTFAIGVHEQDFNELPYARLVAEHCHTDHVEHCVQADVIRLLPQLVWHLDAPSDPIAACMYHAARLAAPHVKVVLGGDGGDELFAGFDRYLGLLHLHRYAMLPALLRERVFGPLLARLPDSFTYKSLVQKLRWVQELAALDRPGERYAAATCFFRFGHAEKRALFSDDLWREVGGLDSAGVIVQQFEQASATTLVDRMLYADFTTRLPEHSLLLTDRMTMAHSLEARSPLLDHELVEYLATFPSNLKIHGRELKYILRKVGRDYLPPEILRRQKQGFMFPVAYWFQNELHDFVRRYLLDSYFVRSGLFRPQLITQLLDEHRARRVDHHVRLWLLLSLTVWHQLYIEGHTIETVTNNMR